jgi:hypothetical protein
MIDPLLDAATRVLELADAAADAAETGERASTVAERDYLRRVSRLIAEGAQIFAQAEEAHARGTTRPHRATSPRLFALREAALHMRQLVEKQIVGPPEEGGATGRPIDLSETTDAMLRNTADWLAGNARVSAVAHHYLIGAGAVRAYLAERIAHRETDSA